MSEFYGVKKSIHGMHWYTATKRNGLCWFCFGDGGSDVPVMSIVSFDESDASRVVKEVIDNYTNTHESRIKALNEIKQGFAVWGFGPDNVKQ